MSYQERLALFKAIEKACKEIPVTTLAKRQQQRDLDTLLYAVHDVVQQGDTPLQVIARGLRASVSQVASDTRPAAPVAVTTSGRPRITRMRSSVEGPRSLSAPRPREVADRRCSSCDGAGHNCANSTCPAYGLRPLNAAVLDNLVRSADVSDSTMDAQLQRDVPTACCILVCETVHRGGGPPTATCRALGFDFRATRDGDCFHITVAILEQWLKKARLPTRAFYAVSKGVTRAPVTAEQSEARSGTAATSRLPSLALSRQQVVAAAATMLPLPRAIAATATPRPSTPSESVVVARLPNVPPPAARPAQPLQGQDVSHAPAAATLIPRSAGSRGGNAHA